MTYTTIARHHAGRRSIVAGADFVDCDIMTFDLIVDRPST